MITFLHGRLTSALPTQAIVDVGGVGYEVFIPLSSYDKLPAPGASSEEFDPDRADVSFDSADSVSGRRIA